MSNSTFFGIEMGRRALSTFRNLMDIVGHNVANSETPGYHRQRAVVTSTDPYAMPSFNQGIGAYQVGTGVTVSAIERLISENTEDRLRVLNSDYEYENIRYQFLSQIESIDAIQNGIHDRLDEFFNAFQDLANTPEQTTTRALVVQRGVTLSLGINEAAQMIVDLREDADQTVQQSILDINNLLLEIRDYNVLIRKVASAGDAPNDLKDQRDELISQLSELVNIQVEENQQNGAVNVYIGGRVVVQDDEYLALAGVMDPANSNFLDVRYSDDLAGADVVLSTGQLKAMLDVRDSTTDGLLYYKQQIDTLATNLIATINVQHTAGFDLGGVAGGNFFDPVVAADPAINMAVTAALQDPLLGPGRVAAASAAASIPGDGSNALAIAQLSRNAFVAGYTPSDFMSNYIGNLGGNLKAINERKESTDDLRSQVMNIRDEISDVSLDEEATMLIEYQNSYTAAAKIITAYNEMYDVLMNLI